MTGRIEIQLSLDLIDRAKRRLAYQQTAIKRLNFDRDTRCSVLAREMEAAMKEKVAILQSKHSILMGGL